MRPSVMCPLPLHINATYMRHFLAVCDVLSPWTLTFLAKNWLADHPGSGNVYNNVTLCNRIRSHTGGETDKSHNSAY